MRVLSGGALRHLDIRRRGELPKSMDTPVIIIRASHLTKKEHHIPRSGNQGEQAANMDTGGEEPTSSYPPTPHSASHQYSTSPHSLQPVQNPSAASR